MADDVRPLAAPHPAPTHPPPAVPRPRRFSGAEFDALVKAGIIAEGSRVELIGGGIIEMSSKGFPHADAATYFAGALWRAYGGAYDVVMTSRLDVNADTQAYPDIMVVQAGTRTRERGPDTVPLLIEIASRSIRYDRDHKGPHYAAAGFREYWIYEPEAGRLWVHRDPAPDGGWGSVTRHAPGEILAPLLAPEVRITVPAAFAN